MKKRTPPFQNAIPKLATSVGSSEVAPATMNEPITNLPVRESLTLGLSAPHEPGLTSTRRLGGAARIERERAGVALTAQK